MKWRRDQKITLAIDILTNLTNSKLKDALEIVAEACRKEGLIDADPETIKKIRDRVRKKAKKREAKADAVS